MTLTNLTNKPVRIVSAGDPHTLIVNRDITNQVLYGPQSIYGGNVNQYSILDPLGSVTADGSTDVYAMANSGSPTIDVISSGTNWVPSPAMIAQQIAAQGLATAANQATFGGTQATSANQATQNGYLAGTTPSALVSTAGRTTPQEIAALIASGNAGGTAGGIPLLRFTNNIGFGSNTNVPAASTTSLFSTTNVMQPGYEGVFTLYFPATSGTIPFCRLNFIWTDLLTGLTVATRHFYLTAGNGSANALSFYLAGPCRGNQLAVSITNLDPSFNGTLTWGINQTSHVYLRDFLVQQSLAATAPNGFTNPNGDPAAGVMVESTPSIAANTTGFRLAGVYGGRAVFAVNNTGASGLTAALVDPAQIYGSTIANQRLVTMNLAAGTSQTVEVSLPYGPVNVQLVNLSTTTAVSPNVGLVALDY